MVVVEHDADMIEVADEVVDMGLGAGELGRPRRLLGQRSRACCNEPRSLTAKYLRDDLAIPVPAARRQGGTAAAQGARRRASTT